MEPTEPAPGPASASGQPALAALPVPPSKVRAKLNAARANMEVSKAREGGLFSAVQKWMCWLDCFITQGLLLCAPLLDQCCSFCAFALLL